MSSSSESDDLFLVHLCCSGRGRAPSPLPRSPRRCECLLPAFLPSRRLLAFVATFRASSASFARQTDTNHNDFTLLAWPCIDAANASEYELARGLADFGGCCIVIRTAVCAKVNLKWSV